MFLKREACLAAAAVAAGLFVSSARAATPTNVRVDDSVNNDLITGNGNQIDNFQQDTENGVTVSIKPRNRDISFGGEPTAIIGGDHYIVQAGQSANNPARPQLVFDYQFDPRHGRGLGPELRPPVGHRLQPGVRARPTSPP